VLIVLSNAPPEAAERIARTLVTEKRAACISLTPVTSVCTWKDALQMDDEVTLVIKVSRDGVAKLRERLRELHPYDLPEIVTLEVDAAASLGAYVDWVRSQCRIE
jgi:periplasmic divalent cation tolerance protein